MRVEDLKNKIHCDTVGRVLHNIYDMIEGSLNSKLPTIWRVEKQMKSR